MSDLKNLTEDGGKPVQESGAEEKKGGEQDEDCGWCSIKPECCRRFRNPDCVLFCLCCAALLQGIIVNGFVSSVISSLERRFELSSTASGTIASCYDIGFVLFAIPISYFGGFGVKPRYLSVGMFLLGSGSLLFALPHFTTELYVPTSGMDRICLLNVTRTSSCSTKSTTSLPQYKYVFFLGQLLNGIGAAPLYTLGVTYLDENLPLRLTSVYVSIFYAFSILGSAVGYLLGGELLKLHTAIGSIDTSRLAIDSSNPRWVGAWWLGFLFAGVLSLVVSGALGGFPRSLPGSGKYLAEKGSEVYVSKNGGGYAETDGKQRGVTNLLLSTKLISLNPTFILLTLAASIEDILVGGFTTFGPKFIEHQFGLTSSSAGQYMGVIVIPSGVGGTLLGGYLVKRLRLHIRGIIRLCLVCVAMAAASALVILINCENELFAGVNIKYGEAPPNRASKLLGGVLDDTCNAGCGCTDEYHPVCGRDDVMYFSPCYAGCTNVSRAVGQKYSHCRCINVTETSSTPFSAEFGKCNTPCKWLPVFIPFFTMTMFFTFMCSIPILTATLRCVPLEQKSFALGIQWIICRCLGSIPGPLLFGKIIDLTCELWQTRCDEKGSCFFYDNPRLSSYLFALTLSLKVVTFSFFGLASRFYRAPPKNEVLDTSKDATSIPNISNTPQHEKTERAGKLNLNYVSDTDVNRSAPPKEEDLYTDVDLDSSTTSTALETGTTEIHGKFNLNFESD